VSLTVQQINGRILDVCERLPLLEEAGEGADFILKSISAGKQAFSASN